MLIELAIFLGTVALLAPFLLKWYQRLFYCDAWKLPGPPGVFLFGNMFDFGSGIEEFFTNLNIMVAKYGSILRVWQGPNKLQVIISDPNYIEKVLTSNVHLDKGAGYDGYIPWLGNGLLNSKAGPWRRQRKLITPTFHFKILEQFVDTFNSAGNVFVEVMKKEIGNEPVDIGQFLKLYALDTICESSMGIKINAQLKENKDYVYAVEHFLEIYMLKYFSLLMRCQWYYRMTELYKKEQQILKTLKNMTKLVIKTRIDERGKLGNKEESINEFGIKKKKAFLDLLLDLKDDGQLSEQEVNDNVNTFLFGGHDTISTVMAFCIFLAAKYPKFQSMIVEEIRSVVGEDNQEPITMAHIQELKFMERFLKEVMRIYAPVPFIERTLAEKFQIGDYMLPKGTNVLIQMFALQRNEKLFPDPEKFDPDRFLPENISDRHPFAYIPFSAGARNCIGMRYAWLQLKITFANILRNLEFSAVVPEHKLRLGDDAILKAINGTPVHIKIRN